MRLLQDAEFGVRTFFGLSEEVGEKCGVNGLPLTPPSIRMIGKFQKLKSLDHPHLCKYLDIQRGKHDHVFIISEHYNDDLTSLFSFSFDDRIKYLPKLAFDLFSALEYLHGKGLAHRSLSVESIHLNKKKEIKLSQFGVYYLTENETLISFCTGNPFYFAPEILACPKRSKNGPKVDIWAAGIVLIEFLLGGRFFSSQDEKTLSSFVSQLLTFVAKVEKVNAYDLIWNIAADNAGVKHVAELKSRIPKEWHDFISQCLIVSPADRPNSSNVLQSDLFKKLTVFKEHFQTSLNDVFLNLKRTDDLTIESIYESSNEDSSFDDDLFENPIRLRPIEEVYFLWKLAGSGVEVILRKKGMIKSRPPINALPSLSVHECDMFGREKERQHLTDLSATTLSMSNLLERLKSVDVEQFYPCLELKNDHSLIASHGSIGGSSSASIGTLDVSLLPKVVKEKDIEYQLTRMILFDRLIDAYPFKKSSLWTEARIDIPPLYRGLIWAALLDVKGDIVDIYNTIDKETMTPTDRQIEVDIPRCHQYDELLSSPESHGKFKRILKAWVVSHPNYVYWQGLDSLCAPFLYLNFNYESLAFACLSNFIPKYLHNFFLKDNSSVIQEYLAVFNHLVAFHDPDLYFHMFDIGFTPELYAIPWFLTMFAHVFPLHKLFHLWDTLLLGNNSFPLCVGVAILLQLRDRLMEFDFNECILLFSDMPEVDIENCVRQSVKIFCSTLKSAFYRQHMPPSSFRNRSKSGSFTDYTLDIGSPLGMEPLTLNELKDEHCPRICADELIHISGFSDCAKSQQQLKLFCVDIRPYEEFLRGTFSGCVNIPHALLSSDIFVSPSNTPAVESLKQNKGNVIVVIGTKDSRASEFASFLMRRHFQNVCILHKGFDVLRHTNLLTVPPVDL